jgi:NitT/TauT family transport system substrate-binding protein
MADDVTLQLKWVTQAQFAGYYVAAAKGFYEEENLNVTILPGGPDIAPHAGDRGWRRRCDGGLDAVGAGRARKGAAAGQHRAAVQASGMMLTCLKETGITSAEDFKGKTLGVWFFGNEYPFLSWMSKLGIPTDGGGTASTVLKQGFNVDPLLQKQADCISTMTYNEYWQVIDAGMTPDELVTFKYEDQGVATLEDGLYVLEEKLSRSGLRRQDGAFVRASMKGWKYAEATRMRPR